MSRGGGSSGGSASPLTVDPGPIHVRGGTTATDRTTFGNADDVNLFRSSATELRSTNNIEAELELWARMTGASQVTIGEKGPGATAGILFGIANDINLYRSAAGIIKTDGDLHVVGDILARSVGNAVKLSGGTISFGGGADVNVYRGAANQLWTDDGLNLNSGPLAGAANPAPTIYAGTGAPNNANGVNGDIYFRLDGGALTTIYQRRAGAWAGIV